MALFKVHTAFLTRHSEVLRDMIELGQKDKNPEEEVDKPLVLQDKARGWEALLYLFYRE
jgi:hypothetical protein